MNFSPASLLGGLSGISNSAASIGSLLGVSPQTYFDQLQPASWRGIPFVVLAASSKFGRRVQEHEYPFRDFPWLEDMGRKSRAFRLQGYIFGDDVIDQRNNLLSAVETAGPGGLVHPTFGAKTVTLVDFEIIERWEKGRYFELVFAFVESGPRINPTVVVATQNNTQSLLGGLLSGSALDFANDILTTVSSGAAMAQTVASTVLSWAGQAELLVKDASNLYHLICQLPGDFGRFFGASASNNFQTNSKFQNVSVTSLISQGAQNRQVVANASQALLQAAQSLDANSIPAFCIAAQALSTAVLATTVNPADSVRILEQLAAFEPSASVPNSAVGQMMTTAQNAAGALFRRAAIASLATATTQYQPTSFNDAQTVLIAFSNLIDSEILTAGDSGDDNSFTALRALRKAVVADLIARGSALAKLTTYTFNQPLPAMYLANRIYQDSTRSDQLIAQVNPRHPAFMPTVFNALAN